MSLTQEGDWILDDSEPIPHHSPSCTLCAHWHYTRHRTCDAFPDGIPMVIWLGENNHHDPYPNDHGIQFERVTRDSFPPHDEDDEFLIRMMLENEDFGTEKSP
jgi:hypothetical protein